MVGFKYLRHIAIVILELQQEFKGKITFALDKGKGQIWKTWNIWLPFGCEYKNWKLPVIGNYIFPSVNLCCWTITFLLFSKVKARLPSTENTVITELTKCCATMMPANRKSEYHAQQARKERLFSTWNNVISNWIDGELSFFYFIQTIQLINFGGFCNAILMPTLQFFHPCLEIMMVLLSFNTDLKLPQEYSKKSEKHFSWRKWGALQLTLKSVNSQEVNYKNKLKKKNTHKH